MTSFHCLYTSTLLISSCAVNRDLSASGEPWHPNVASWGHPSVIKNVPSVADTWDLQAARADLASRYHKWWQASGFDGIICPTTPLPALKHLKGDEGIGTLEYCVYGCCEFHLVDRSIRKDSSYHRLTRSRFDDIVSPVLGLTTGVFPVTKVDQVRDIVPSSFVAKSEYDQRVMDFCESTSSPSLNSSHALISYRRYAQEPRERFDRTFDHRWDPRGGEGRRYDGSH